MKEYLSEMKTFLSELKKPLAGVKECRSKVKQCGFGMIVLLLIAGLAGCGSEAAESTAVSDLLEPVGVKLDTAQAVRNDIYEITAYNGQIEPYVEDLYFTVDGTLEEMKVVTGEFVKEGQVLAVLSEENLTEQIEALEDEIENIRILGEFSDRQAQADIQIARVELELMKEAGSSDVNCRIKEVDIRELELTLEQNREMRQLELEEKERQLKVLQQKAGSNTIVAPFDGRVVYVSELKAKAGVQSYTTVLCLADETRLRLTTEYISETEIGKMDRVSAKVAGQEYEIVYEPYDSNEYISKILAGEEIRTNFTIQADANELECGQFAEIIMLDNYQEKVLTVPVNAVYRDQNGTYVYKMEDNQKVRCSVKVGTTTDVEAEIEEGLEEGDVVYVKD